MLNSHCDQTKETGLGVQQTLNVYMEATSLRWVLGHSQDLGLGSERSSHALTRFPAQSSAKPEGRRERASTKAR